MAVELMLAILLLLLGVAAALTARSFWLRALLLGGVALSTLAWVPLVLVGTLDPDSNPVGLGLLAWCGTAVGVAGVALGLVGWAVGFVVELARGRGDEPPGR